MNKTQNSITKEKNMNQIKHELYLENKMNEKKKKKQKERKQKNYGRRY